jgi:hypothetical protein
MMVMITAGAMGLVFACSGLGEAIESPYEIQNRPSSRFGFVQHKHRRIGPGGTPD